MRGKKNRHESEFASSSSTGATSIGTNSCRMRTEWNQCERVLVRGTTITLQMYSQWSHQWIRLKKYHSSVPKGKGPLVIFSFLSGTVLGWWRYMKNEYSQPITSMQCWKAWRAVLCPLNCRAKYRGPLWIFPRVKSFKLNFLNDGRNREQSKRWGGGRI